MLVPSIPEFLEALDRNIRRQQILVRRVGEM
jgi:hypothetical protein